jgi:hypothetical protein
MNKKPGIRPNGYQPYWACIAKRILLWLYTERPNGKALSQMKEMSVIVPEILIRHLSKGISSYLPYSEKPIKNGTPCRVRPTDGSCGQTWSY